MRNVGYRDGAILTADGCVSAIGSPTSNACCPPLACQIDACSLVCSFVELLPNGPLWDRSKRKVLDKYFGASPCAPICQDEEGACASVVDYAVFSAVFLDNLIKGPLWASLRESSPETAVETLDSWLDRLGWQDCWDSACRDPRLGPSPYECGATEPPLGRCDDNFSPVYTPTMPNALSLAVKRGIARSLSRLQMAPIKNLCGINWVIEPLSAVVRPTSAQTSACCSGMQWEICNVGTTIERAGALNCFDNSKETVNAFFSIPELAYDPDSGTCVPSGSGVTVQVWPGVLAAQCIALSMMPQYKCSTPLTRCVDIS